MNKGVRFDNPQIWTEPLNTSVFRAGMPDDYCSGCLVTWLRVFLLGQASTQAKIVSRRLRQTVYLVVRRGCKASQQCPERDDSHLESLAKTIGVSSVLCRSLAAV